MAKKNVDEKVCCKKSSCKCVGSVYGLGFIGAAIYYVSISAGFWMGVWGIIKALVWPAILVYELFNWLGI